MCGIIGFFRQGEQKQPVNNAVLSQYEDQHLRGSKGFGIIKIGENKSYKIDRATEGYKFMYDIHQDPVKGMILHHRTPTSSDNLMNQTHPIEVDNGSLKYKYLVVHNGIIYNDDELKKAHEELGFVYTTDYKDKSKFNDSESFAIEIARYIEGQTKQLEVDGSLAFICLQVNKKTDKVNKLFFGRNTNPLNMAKTRGELYLSSEGKGDEITADTLYECNLDEEMKLSKRKIIFKEKETKIVGFEDEKAKTCVQSYWKGYDDHYGRDTYFDRYYKGNKETSISNDFPEDEQTPLEIAMEDRANEIASTVESFLDLLYNDQQVETVTERDVELTLESIKIILKEAMEEAKEMQMEKVIKEDYTPTVI